MPYHPATNADGAGLTVAVDHAHLYTDTVYIKDLHHSFSKQHGSALRWAAEVRAFERLSKRHSHPSIIRYLGCRVTHGRITGIVLELAERCLCDYSVEAPAFQGVDVNLVMDRLEAAVLFLHSIGLAHNDIKPANVMLHADNQPLLIDFESCAPPGEKIWYAGNEGWTDGQDRVYRFEHDLYALHKMRERIHDEEAVREFFQS